MNSILRFCHNIGRHSVAPLLALVACTGGATAQEMAVTGAAPPPAVSASPVVSAPSVATDPSALPCADTITVPGGGSTGEPERPAESSAEAVPTPSESDTIVRHDFPRITQEEYTFAGNPMFTMTGKLPYRETHIETVPFTIFGGALLGLAGFIAYYQQAWYPDSTKGPFNFDANWRYSLQVDKAGHAVAAWIASYCTHEALIASGFSKDDAALWGAAGGLFWQTFIEVQDGFHSNYGFDWTDQLGNIAGAAYFYAQHEIPILQNFQPKWSVGPHGRDSARNAAQRHSRILFDDYDAQNVWLSVKVHNLLPDDMKPYWPKWLHLALGVGAKDVELIGYVPYRTWFIALDYDLVEIMPDLGSFGNWLVQGLNSFRLIPSPALQIAPEVKFYLIYPFKL